MCAEVFLPTLFDLYRLSDFMWPESDYSVIFSQSSANHEWFAELFMVKVLAPCKFSKSIQQRPVWKQLMLFWRKVDKVFTIYRVSKKKVYFLKWAILGALKASLWHTLQLVALTYHTRVCPGTTGNVFVSYSAPYSPYRPYNRSLHPCICLSIERLKFLIKFAPIVWAVGCTVGTQMCFL